MMKRVFKLIIFVICLIPIKVNALTGNVEISCNPNNAKENDIITCNIIANAVDGEVTGFSADIVLSSGLEVDSFIPDSTWQGDGSANKIGLYTAENKKDGFNIGILKIKVKPNVVDSNETISLNNVIYSDSNFNKVNISSVNKNIRITSLNNYLKALSISVGSINFNPNTLSYSVTVNSDNIVISCEKEDSKATLSGDIGSMNLKYGVNTFKINVTSESGEVRTYVLNVTRVDNRNSENKINSLTISGVSLKFDENKTEYNVSVDNKVSSVKISASLKDNSSSFVNGYGPRTVNLVEGNNRVELRISAENGVIRTYVINIKRDEDPDNRSDDNYLKDLNIKDNDIDFSKDKTNYEITVDYNTDSLDINPKLSSGKSNVEIIGNENLKVGENTIIVRVTAKDKSVREYKIIVTKKDKDQVLSNNSYLKSITIEGYNIDFKKNVYSYTLEINDEETLNINAVAEDENAKVRIVGNNNLNNNNVIKIIVTAEDKSVSTYSITISKKKNINYLLITVIIETVIIIGIILYLALRKKKSDLNEEV